jgi:hypothetical protein
MATFAAWLASSALASTMKSAAKALTRRSWKRAVRSMLDAYCESYAWDEESEQNELSVVVKDVVLKKSELEALLLATGLHVGEGCTIGKIRFCISLGLNMDMELFTKPWRIEVDHFRLNIGCGARAECDVRTEVSPQLTCSSEVSSRPSKLEEWLPLHRAVENLQLILQNATVSLHSSNLAGSLIFKIDTVKYTTTNEHWSPMTTTTSADYAGGIVHKLLTFEGFEAFTDRAVSPLDSAFVDCSGPWDLPFDDADGTLLPVPQLTHVKVLFNGLQGNMKIIKKLKSSLTGRVVTDFFGDVYIFKLCLVSGGVPKLRIPHVALRLEWSEHAGTYVLNMEEAVQFSISHQIDAEVLAEIHAWLIQLLEARAEVAPSTETQLSYERARRFQEQAYVGRLHKRLDELKETFREKFIVWRSGTKSVIDDLNMALSEEQQRRDVLENSMKAQQEILSQTYQKLQAQLVDGSPGEQANAVSEAMRAMVIALDPKSHSTPTQRVPFEGGYQLGDVSRKTLRWFSKTH